MITDVRRPSTKNRAALGQVKGRSKRRKPFEMLIIHGESQLRLVSPNKKKIVLGAEQQEQVLVLRTCGKWEWTHNQRPWGQRADHWTRIADLEI